VAGAAGAVGPAGGSGAGLLLVPLRDAAGTLHSLQAIAPDGTKRFLPGGRVRGCYHGMGKPSGVLVAGQPCGVLVVAEGYATAASIHAATGLAVAAAFSASNLEPVAQALRRKYPALTLVLAADDDWRTEGNPGKAAAQQTALAVGGLLVVPHFPAQRDGATDFNDLHRLAGLGAVRACFAEVLEGLRHDD
jgi:putative DNA primase/helicase